LKIGGVLLKLRAFFEKEGEVFYLFENLAGEKVMLILQLTTHLGEAFVIMAFKQPSLLYFSAEVCIEALQEGVEIVLEVTL
jgi:hypothetical protein